MPSERETFFFRFPSLPLCLSLSQGQIARGTGAPAHHFPIVSMISKLRFPDVDAYAFLARWTLPLACPGI